MLAKKKFPEQLSVRFTLRGCQWLCPEQEKKIPVFCSIDARGIFVSCSEKQEETHGPTVIPQINRNFLKVANDQVYDPSRSFDVLTSKVAIRSLS